MRTYEVFRYRGGEAEFEKMTKPIRTEFFSNANRTYLKTEIDKMGASITAGALEDMMQQAYIWDDDVQKAELLAARGEVNIRKGVERLNVMVLSVSKRKVDSNAKAAHERYLKEATAYLSGDQKKIYTYFDPNDPQMKYTRLDTGRHNGGVDMYRF